MKKEKLKDAFAIVKRECPAVCMSLLCGWFISLVGAAALNEYAFTKVPDFAKSVSLLPFLAALILFAALIYLAQRFLFKFTVVVALPICFAVYAISSIADTAGDAHAKAYTALVFIILLLAVLALVINFMQKHELTVAKRDLDARWSFAIVCAAFVAISAYFIVVLGSRTAAYCSPCYDMGIFAQMYDNMTETGLPFTTCERGEHLSHFAVHFSPILYLLLPFCYIFKVTDVLVWSQILVVFLGVFPLFLICRRIKLSNIKTTLICLVYLLYPAMSSGAFYDFHENAFLAPFILWTLYFIHAEKWIPTFACALGVLMVKEDAAMYVGFIALYVIFARKKIVRGILMFLMTFVYFLFAMWMLMQGGEGIMLGGRYFNIIGYSGSFVDLIRVALVNPALYAAESFTYEKLLYALNMLVPLAFLPIMTRKVSRWLLIAPLFVINLITDYQYQYNLTFQYSFGSGALLVYLAAINLADLSDAPFDAPIEDLPAETPLPREAAELREPCENCDENTVKSNGNEKNTRALSGSRSTERFRAALAASLAVVALTSSLFLGAARAPGQFFYVERVIKDQKDFDTIEEVLSRIDRSKSVMATSMYLTHLYDVDELYHTSQALAEKKSATTGKVVGYTLVIPTDIAILDLRPYVSDSSSAMLWRKAYIEAGYQVVEEHDGLLLVMEKKD